MLRTYFLFTTLITSSASLAASPSASQCIELFTLPSELGQLDPIPQLFQWEQRYNLARFQKPTEPIQLEYSLEAKSETEILKVDIESQADSLFENADQVLWPKHPLNTDPKVPHHESPAIGSLNANYSASRSLFTFAHIDLYSVKPPTNQLSPNDALEPAKAERGDGPALSIQRSQDILDTDRLIGESPYLKVLLDIASYTDKKTQNGFIVRDLRPLQDGNYYLPSFSIPYVGAEIAARFKDQGEFREFWATHYAAAIGRAKAELFLRYGLVANYPNAQNTLVQLDKNFLPTGRIFLRDITDTRYHETAAGALGYEPQVRRDHKAGIPLMVILEIKSDVSFVKMENAGVPLEVVKYWELRHDQAFAERIATELGFAPDKFKKLAEVQMFFNTNTGIEALRAYAAKRSPPR